MNDCGAKIMKDYEQYQTVTKDEGGARERQAATEERNEND